MNTLNYYYDQHKDILIVEGKSYDADLFRKDMIQSQTVPELTTREDTDEDA